MSISLKADNFRSKIICKFKDDTEYFDALKILINSSTELNSKINFLKEKILPNVDKTYILDIGIGDGEFSKTIYQNFETIHLIDPSELALNSIQQDQFPYKTIEKFNSKIENFVFPLNLYNFILNCHTLYHVKRESWKDVIEKSCKSLCYQGIQLLVLNNGLGRSDLTSFFKHSNIINIERLIEECVSIENITVEVYPSHEQVKIKTLEQAIQISTIFLQDADVSAHENFLVNYLNKNCKKEDNFVIDYCQYFIVLKKNT